MKGMAMSDIFKWLSTSESMQAAEFAQGFWSLIQRKPTAIVVQRMGVNLEPQTVRVEYSKEARESNDRNSAANVRTRDVMLYGVKDHPGVLVDGAIVAVPDTDIRTGDLFSLDGRLFRVTDVYSNPGQIEIEGVAIS
jgi:hypothetical protein